MKSSDGRKTSQQYWNNAWALSQKNTLPSCLYIDIFNFTRLLSQHVNPSDKYLEIGCAPGKLLAWVAKNLTADVTGLDYSDKGIASCKLLFSELNLPVKLHHEDIFSNTLLPESFDIVTSFGVIEHFDDPSLIVKCHMDLIKPGGRALICIPNYSRIYLRLQKWVDSDSLERHNLKIMNPRALAEQAKTTDKNIVYSYRFGSLSPWMISWEKKIPKRCAFFLCLILNFMGLLLPMIPTMLSPILVLEIQKLKQ